MRIRSPRAVVAAVLLVCTLSLVGSPAQASGGGYYSPPERYEFADEFDPECEGASYVAAFEVEGISSLRNVKGSGGQAFLVADTFRFNETWRDADTGEVVMSLRGAFDFREISARLVPTSQVPDELIPEEGLVGPVYEFTATETGWETIRDGEGDVRYRTAGLVVYKALFDTLGDFQPGGTFLDERVVKVVGPHPLLDRDICDVAAELAA
jgi:hypothetical protein